MRNVPSPPLLRRGRSRPRSGRVALAALASLAGLAGCPDSIALLGDGGEPLDVPAPSDVPAEAEVCDPGAGGPDSTADRWLVTLGAEGCSEGESWAVAPDWWYSRSLVLTFDGGGNLRNSIALEAPFRMLPEGIAAVPGAGVFFVGARSHGATAIENRMVLVRLDERLDLAGDVESEVLPWSRFHHGVAAEPGFLYAVGRSMRSVDGTFRDLRIVVARAAVDLEFAAPCPWFRVPSLTRAPETLVEVEPGIELLPAAAEVVAATATVRPLAVPVLHVCGT